MADPTNCLGCAVVLNIVAFRNMAFGAFHVGVLHRIAYIVGGFQKLASQMAVAIVLHHQRRLSYQYEGPKTCVVDQWYPAGCFDEQVEQIVESYERILELACLME